MTASPPVGCFAHLASVIRAWDAKARWAKQPAGGAVIRLAYRAPIRPARHDRAALRGRKTLPRTMPVAGSLRFEQGQARLSVL